MNPKARGRAKRDLIAQAMVVAVIYEKTALDIRATVGELLSKRMTERDMVEGVSVSALTVFNEAPLIELWAKLAQYEVEAHG